MDGKKDQSAPAPQKLPQSQHSTTDKVPEVGGPKGAEPTRYGDWEKNGRVSDF